MELPHGADGLPAYEDWHAHSTARSNGGRCDSAAQFSIGVRLLLGRDIAQDPIIGLSLLRAAAESGYSEALTLLATLSAAGGLVPQSWNDALDFLQQACVRGSRFARGQMRVLSADRALASRDARTAADWAELRRSIDIDAWLQPPPRTKLCEAPRVRSAEHFATPAVCGWLIDQARGRLKPALMYDGSTSRLSIHRRCSDFFFSIDQAGIVMPLLRARAAALMSLPVLTMEPPQIIHYGVGDEFRAHTDLIRPVNGAGPERIATLLVYLNDGYEGGELEFVKVGLRHKGRCGDCVYFANLDSAGQPDRDTLHLAQPVHSGEKWMLSQWLQDRPVGIGA